MSSRVRCIKKIRVLYLLENFMLYCKYSRHLNNFGHLKILNGFNFGHFLCPKVKLPEFLDK